jgi:hypothetical protein
VLKLYTVVYPVMPARDEAERAALRPIGRNSDLYHAAIHGWTDVVKAADEMGVWGVAGIEHHFWSEGYEVGPSPGTLDAYWAAITKNIHVGTHYAQTPKEVVIETLDLFMRHIKPALDEVIDETHRSAAA